MAKKNLQEQRMIEYYKRGIEKWDLNAMYNYVCLLFQWYTIDKNQDETLKYFKKRLDKGHSNSMNNCKYMFEHGIRIIIEKKEALKYYNLSILKRNIPSLYN